MTALNSTAASLLGLLLDGPLAAGDLVAVARERIGGFWNLTRSQVYRELDALERAGLAELVAADPDQAAATRRYRVTGSGAAAFGDWAAGPLEEPTTRLALLLLLSLGKHVDAGRLRAVLEDQHDRHSRALAGYVEAIARHGRALDPYARATIDFGIAYERAVLGWLEALPPAVRGRGPIGRRPRR